MISNLKKHSSKPIKGIFTDYKTTVEEFKQKHAELMKGHWVDVRHGTDSSGIYELFEEGTSSEIIKENLQEWMCNNRYEITSCIKITLRNHNRTYAEWFKYVDDCSGPDELAIYCLCRRYGVHCAIFNSGYVWTTLGNHLMSSDEEVFKRSKIRLVYLGENLYGIIRVIRQPSPSKYGNNIDDSSNTKQTACGRGRGCTRGKTTGRTGTRGRKAGAPRGSRPRTLSAARNQQYGIPAVPTPRPYRLRQKNRLDIDYLQLNDGLDEETPVSPKRPKRSTHTPSRSGPSPARMSDKR